MNGIRWSVLQKIKLLRQLYPQYERPSKPSFPTETLRQQSFLSELTKKKSRNLPLHRSIGTLNLSSDLTRYNIFYSKLPNYYTTWRQLTAYD